MSTHGRDADGGRHLAELRFIAASHHSALFDPCAQPRAGRWIRSHKARRLVREYQLELFSGDRLTTQCGAMADEDPNAKEWTDEEGRRDLRWHMPWSGLYPYRLTTFALGRVERNPWLYSLGIAVFAASGLIGLFIILSLYAFIRARYGELSEEIAVSIVFLPLAVFGLYSILTGYIPSSALNHIHRGRRVIYHNVGLIVVYGVLVGLIFAIGLV